MSTIIQFIPQLEKAIKLTGTHDVADVIDAVLRDEARIFANDTGMIVAEVEEYPKGRVLNYWVAAGDMDGVLGLLPEVAEWGKSEGCSLQRMAGRRGWKKVLTRLGWDEREVTMHKEL